MPLGTFVSRCVSLFQRVTRVKKIDEGEEEGVGLSEEEIAALSQGTFQLPTLDMCQCQWNHDDITPSIALLSLHSSPLIPPPLPLSSFTLLRSFLLPSLFLPLTLLRSFLLPSLFPLFTLPSFSSPPLTPLLQRKTFMRS